MCNSLYTLPYMFLYICVRVRVRVCVCVCRKKSSSVWHHASHAAAQRIHWTAKALQNDKRKIMAELFITKYLTNWPKWLKCHNQPQNKCNKVTSHTAHTESIPCPWQRPLPSTWSCLARLGHVLYARPSCCHRLRWEPVRKIWPAKSAG